MKIQCDAKYLLEILHKKIKKYNSDNRWIKYCKNIRNKYPVLINKMKNEKRYVNSYFFVKTLSNLIKQGESIITVLGFSFTTSHQAMDIKRTKILSLIPDMLQWDGATCCHRILFFIKKKNSSNRLTGEGGFQMNIQELATTCIIKYR